VWQYRQKCPQIGFKMGHLSMCTSGFSDFFFFCKIQNIREYENFPFKNK
jgi:hypothetical protein